MKLTSLACTALIALGLTAPAVAKPEMVPHRGIWKSYKGKNAAQNSVEAYMNAARASLKATQKRPKFIEVDIRVIDIDSVSTAVVYHDDFWDRQTTRTFSQNAGDWASRTFAGNRPTAHSLDQYGATHKQMNNIRLRRFNVEGEADSTGDKLLPVKEFVEQTSCIEDTILLLDIQSVEAMRLSAIELRTNSCPDGTNHQGKLLAERAYLRPFVGNVVPYSFVSNADTLAADLITHYGSTNNYVWGINSGQLDGCTNLGCKLYAKEPSLLYNVYSFIDGALEQPETEGINFSYPYSFPGRSPSQKADDLYKKATITALYEKYKTIKIPLISSITRPDGALKFDA
ncbi:MAG: hypothetical protein ACX94B_05025 [Henriciella sp.]